MKKEYREYVEEFLENIIKHENSIGIKLDNLDNNCIAYPVNHDEKIKELDKPYFDLEWLLSQNDYHVFYGNKFFTDKNKIHTDSIDELTYSKLNEDDKKMIKTIIESIFETKYDKSKKVNNFKMNK